MKYSLFFAATVAATGDAYYGYPAGQSSSAPVKASSSMPAYGGYESKPMSSAKSTPPAQATPCSTTVGQNGYTTVVPGYGKQPVTVTSQYQPYPTCVQKGYGDSCDKWDEDKYVSTTVTDYNKKVVTVTKIQDYVTVYQEKKTITHTSTICSTAVATGGYAAPTGSYGSSPSKNATGNWYELYEKIVVVQYSNMGKNVLSGYPGSGLCQACDYKQPVVVKEYKGGKWSEEKKDYTYGTPKEDVKVYSQTGVYTVPGKTVTVDYPVTNIETATKSAKAGETCIYGGAYKDVKSTGTITGAYGAVQTNYVNGKPQVVTVTKTVTVFCNKVGKCELSPATTTVYQKDTVITYPTGKVQEAGVYKYEPKVITITKPGQAYTCSYEATATPAYKTPSNGQGYPMVTMTPTANNNYGYKPSATPMKPGQEYPNYPMKSNSTSSAAYNGYAAQSSSAAYNGYAAQSSSAAYNNGYGAQSSVVYNNGYKASTTPCSTLIKATSTPSVPYNSMPVYGDNSKPSTTPAVVYPTPTPVYNNNYNNGGYGDNSKPSSSAPAKASSTPCDEDKKATPTPVYNNGGYNAQPTPTPAKPTQVYNSYPVASAPAGGYSKRAGIAERRAQLANAL